jgi:S1-C subfamily serine protease
VVLAVLAVAGPAAARPTSTEGFSESVEGLPDSATEVWQATVMIDNTKIASSSRMPVRRGQTWGSGVILEIIEEQPGQDRTALIVTNAHVVACDQKQCHPRVRFGDATDGAGRWTSEVRVVAQNPEKDLAFLSVQIPDDVPVSVARLGGLSDDDRQLLAIGWPNLELRKEWHGDRPRNRRRVAKRFSQGSLMDTQPRYYFRARPGLEAERISVLFHSADVLPGNSGGPVLDSQGTVVGLNTKILRLSERPGDYWAHCYADPEPTSSPCLYLALSSEEISDEFTRAFGRRIASAESSAPYLSVEETRFSLDDRQKSEDFNSSS